MSGIKGTITVAHLKLKAPPPPPLPAQRTIPSSSPSEDMTRRTAPVQRVPKTAPPPPWPPPGQRKAQTKPIFASLEATWPEGFGKPVRPWTRSDVYLKAIEQGGRRVNLDGSDGGEITENERLWARKQLNDRKAASAMTSATKMRGKSVRQDAV